MLFRLGAACAANCGKRLTRSESETSLQIYEYWHDYPF